MWFKCCLRKVGVIISIIVLPVSREPIKSIVWQYSVTEANKYGNKAQAYRLVTLGADGLIMVRNGS